MAQANGFDGGFDLVDYFKNRGMIDILGANFVCSYNQTEIHNQISTSALAKEGAHTAQWVCCRGYIIATQS